MARVTLRQLLDHAAENGYGVPAFNVNNLEQVQAIMEAAARSMRRSSCRPRRRAQVRRRHLLSKHLIQARRDVSEDSDRDAPGPRQESPTVCDGASSSASRRVMMDGSLQGRRQDDRRTTTTTSTSPQGGRHGARARRHVEGELGCLGSLETMRGDKEDGHGAEGTMTREKLLTDPDQAADFVKQTPARRAGDRHRHQPRRLQVHPQARPATSWRSTHQGNPPPHPEHAPGDARLLVGAAGPAAGDPPVRRRDEGNLRRAGRGDPGRHQARRAQDQHRHRHPAGDDRGDPQVPAPRTRANSIRATT